MHGHVPRSTIHSRNRPIFFPILLIAIGSLSIVSKIISIPSNRDNSSKFEYTWRWNDSFFISSRNRSWRMIDATNWVRRISVAYRFESTATKTIIPSGWIGIDRKTKGHRPSFHLTAFGMRLVQKYTSLTWVEREYNFTKRGGNKKKRKEKKRKKKRENVYIEWKGNDIYRDIYIYIHSHKHTYTHTYIYIYRAHWWNGASVVARNSF